MNSHTNENDDEDDDDDEEDDPFSMAVKELSETNRQAEEIARVSFAFKNQKVFITLNKHFFSQQRSIEAQPSKPQSSSPIIINRPLILHGLHAPVPTRPIIRLHRPITIPSSSQTPVHQFIPAFRPSLPSPIPMKVPGDIETEEDDEEDQSAQAADTYSDYMPLKCSYSSK